MARRPALRKSDLATLCDFAKERGLTIFAVASDGRGGAIVQTSGGPLVAANDSKAPDASPEGNPWLAG